MSLAIASINSAWMLGNLAAAARFGRALRDPGAAQRALLRGYLRANAETDYGRRYKFAVLGSLAEFQQRVPLTSYDDYRSYIARIAAGETRVLTGEPVRRFARSSGSASAEKWIPYTRTLLAEFRRALAPWLVNLHRALPALRGGPAYWSITPAGSAPAVDSRVPVGFDEDSAYLGGVFKRLAEGTFAVPGELRHVQDMAGFRYLTLLCLLRARSLRLVSVWHPSFFTLLLASAEAQWDRLLGDIRAGTCRPPGEVPAPALRAVARRARPDPRRADELAGARADRWEPFWPDLGLLSCWSDGHARMPAAELAARFPRAVMQGKGLLSTEAFVSLPVIDGGATHYPLAVRSHLLELLPENGSPVGVDAAEIGGTYTVIVTTGGGFYRYNTHDRVRVTGRYRQTPTVEFQGKTDLISDRFGEKLNASFAAEVLAELQACVGGPRFAMLAPDGPGYTLYIEASDPLRHGTAADLDRLLARNPHYEYCRRLGQLAAARVFVIESGAHAAYLEACRRQGRRLGDIKPTPLHTAGDWRGVFVGDYLGD